MKRESRLTRIIIAACLLILVGGGVRTTAQDAAAEEKRQNIRRLLRLIRAGEVGVQSLQLMLPQMRTLYGALLERLPADKRQRAVKIMEEEMFKVFTAERVVEELVPIYDRHFTNEEIKALIAFHESPAGRKFTEVQPKLLTEASGVGQTLAVEAVQLIQKRMDAEGIVIPSTPPAPTPTPRPRS